MGYRRGYDCDICDTPGEKQEQFIGLSVRKGTCGEVREFAVDESDFHVCMRCATIIYEITRKRLSKT